MEEQTTTLGQLGLSALTIHVGCRQELAFEAFTDQLFENVKSLDITLNDSDSKSESHKKLD